MAVGKPTLKVKQESDMICLSFEKDRVEWWLTGAKGLGEMGRF